MASTPAAKLLEMCEKGLRDLAGKALARGDYTAATKTMSWAKVVRDLAEDAKAESQTSTSAKRLEHSRSTLRAEERQDDRRLAQRGKRSRPPGYPKFLRQDDDLIKIGWSKGNSGEYQHRAPQRVLLLLSSKLAVAGAGGRIFNAEGVFPLIGDNGVEIPNYQSYLCLAWLRSAGLVQPHGRQGYTISNGENIVSAVNSRWQTLPQMR